MRIVVLHPQMPVVTTVITLIDLWVVKHDECAQLHGLC